MAKSSGASQQLRIIGGQFKRRLLPFAAIEGLRPTPDRVRETIFNWLMWDIQGASVLDVCAGSGALGFEALSRGAASAVLIEPHPIQIGYLHDNLKMLGISNAIVMPTTAERALPQLHNTQQQKFDVVFLDPPYGLNLWADLAQLIQPLLHIGSLIYVEANRAVTTLDLPSNWQLQKTTTAGQVQGGLFEYMG